MFFFISFCLPLFVDYICFFFRISYGVYMCLWLLCHCCSYITDSFLASCDFNRWSQSVCVCVCDECIEMRDTLANCAQCTHQLRRLRANKTNARWRRRKKIIIVGLGGIALFVDITDCHTFIHVSEHYVCIATHIFCTCIDIHFRIDRCTNAAVFVAFSSLLSLCVWEFFLKRKLCVCFFCWFFVLATLT